MRFEQLVPGSKHGTKLCALLLGNIAANVLAMHYQSMPRTIFSRIRTFFVLQSTDGWEGLTSPHYQEASAREPHHSGNAEHNASVICCRENYSEFSVGLDPKPHRALPGLRRTGFYSAAPVPHRTVKTPYPADHHSSAQKSTASLFRCCCATHLHAKSTS